MAHMKEIFSMKTKEELNALKEEVETLNKKLAELTDEELALVSSGLAPVIRGRLGIEPTTTKSWFSVIE